MLNIVLYGVLLIISIYFLLKSSDFFVDKSTLLGYKLNISEMVIGLLIISLGTSLPEFISSIVALFTSKDYSGFILGNIIGSNIANVLLIFGFLIVLSNNLKFKVNKLDVITFFSLTFFLILSSFIEKINLLISLVFLVIYFSYVYFNLKNGKEVKENIKVVEESYIFLISEILLSLAFLFVSARGVIYSIDNLSHLLNIPNYVLSLTSVALGTSLPELFVTFSAVKKKKVNIAYGNIIGSNIANIGFVLGFSSLIKPITFFFKDYIFSIIILIISSLFLIIYSYKKPNRFIGIILLALYFAYIIALFIV